MSLTFACGCQRHPVRLFPPSSCSGGRGAGGSGRRARVPAQVSQRVKAQPVRPRIRG
jgi:hypothetical protein